MIDRATVEKIKETANIVEVVGDYVHLVKRGRNYMGLCPFHNERTPSFSVSPSKNICYCFSCHKGGSPVNFLMEKEGISYHDALLQLASKYGIKVEERELTDEEKLEQSDRESKFIANEWSMNQMIQNLLESNEGIEIGLKYFKERGLTDEAIKAFKLGYSIDSFSDLAEKAKNAGYDLEVFESLGLLGKNKNGGYYDKFRGRVIFPILNPAGKVIAFGGRDLKGGLAKYINSPESNIYKKSYELYGIHQAKSDISREDKCFLVEGYMDVIGMWQSGIKNVVASSGTSLTDGQISLIHRFTENITLIYDGDAAGIKASLRGIDMLLSHNMNVKVLLLPDGHDPDSFARENSPEDFRDFIKKNETDIIRFKTKVLLENAENDPQARSEAVKSVISSIACINDQIKRNIYIQECSRLMNLDERIVARETKKRRLKILEQNNQSTNIEDLEKFIEKEKADIDIQQIEKKTGKKNIEKNSLVSYEKEVLRYCLKYGMFDFCEAPSESEEESYLTVVEYVESELNLDNVSFSDPVILKTFELIKGLKEKYYSDYQKYASQLDEVFSEKRSKKIEELMNSDLDMIALENQERRIDESLKNEFEEELREFSIQYLGKELSNDEDTEVRKLVLELLIEKHTLSKRYSKISFDLEIYSKLEDLLPRVITEWKHALINQTINETKLRLEEAVKEGNAELQNSLIEEIMSLTSISAEIARAIGDRVIAPK